MAELEAETFLIGQWKNFEEMEMNLSLPELEAILDAHRDAQYRQNKFMAALKGIDLEAGAASTEDRVQKIKDRVAAKQAGVSEEEYEFATMGLGIEEEEYEEE